LDSREMMEVTSEEEEEVSELAEEVQQQEENAKEAGINTWRLLRKNSQLCESEGIKST